MSQGSRVSQDTELKLFRAFQNLCEANQKLGNEKPPTFDDFMRQAEKIEGCPGDSWLRKKFTEWRSKFYERQENPSLLDERWHLGMLKTCEENGWGIRPEVIPLLLDFQFRMQTPWGEPIAPKTVTLRVARWASQMYLSIPNRGDVEEWGKLVVQMALVYAMKERDCEDAGLPFDTIQEDDLLQQCKYDEISTGYFEWVGADGGPIDLIAAKREKANEKKGVKRERSHSKAG